MRTLLFLLALLVSACAPSGERFDLLILNGHVIDGSGAPAVRADVGIRGDTIVRVGDLAAAARSAAQVIDAAGLAVSPGFIDTHSHSDLTLLADGTAQSKIRQGVTTEVLGESESAGPITGKAPRGGAYGVTPDWTTLGGYFDRLDREGISVNVASYVGSLQVRLCVLGAEESREPTAEETAEMKRLVRQAMEDGAFGLSSALTVPPQTYVSTQQLIDMAMEVKPFGGIYATHTRSGKTSLDGMEEAIRIGESAGIGVEFVHLNNTDRKMWGKVHLMRDLIEGGRNRGLAVTASRYPYIAGQNNLRAILPPWALEGSREEMLARLRDPALRRRMERDIYGGIAGWFNHYLLMGSWDNVRVATVREAANEKFVGKSASEMAAMRKTSPTGAIFDLLLDEGGSVPAVYFMMSEEDVKYTLKLPWVSIGSDGYALRPDGLLGRGKPHPRSYGTFPRVLGKYVREEGVLTWEEAVHKMTALSAEKLGIKDRGLLRAGMKADIAIFDRGTVADKATFEDPHQYPVGIEYVIVNGVTVLERGTHLGTKPGRALRKGKNA
ncbi:MAG: D-aminoacylase [Bryobacterales bacterium]|nr:D-aminoacylase [Bryobacterales bacterium]